MVAMNRCHNDNTRLVTGTYKFRQEISGRMFTATLPARVCPTCGEKMVAYEDIHPVDLEAAAVLAREGPSDGASFKFMRTVLRMKAADLAGLLDVTPESISKWENARTPVRRAAWMVLAELVLDEVGRGARTPVLERLERLVTGKRVQKHVRIATEPYQGSG
jgi:DNA-binding transcriptional regulator YiaG